MSDSNTDPRTARPLPAGADLGRPRLSPKSASELLQPERVPGPPVRVVKRHPVGRFLSFVFTLVVVAALLVGGAIAYGRYEFTRPGPSEESRTVTVAAGSTLNDIAAAFERQGIVSSRWIFWAGVRLSEQEAALKAGEYLIPAGASMSEVMEALVGGRSIAYAITFPEGLTSQQIVERIRANELLVGEITSIPPEGSLLPETYHFQRGDTRENLIARMRRDRDRIITEIWNRRVEGLPIDTLEEFVILASIVERETALADERSRVASVFINRLRQGMRLQSDPTVIYGLYGGGGRS
ncbi:MAG: endolytic transglycosylase MltG, partial [Bauldia sp.]|nr:endolytic transglycosylase MltG [Bauldia sp.]